MRLKSERQLGRKRVYLMTQTPSQRLRYIIPFRLYTAELTIIQQRDTSISLLDTNHTKANWSALPDVKEPPIRLMTRAVAKHIAESGTAKGDHNLSKPQASSSALKSQTPVSQLALVAVKQQRSQYRSQNKVLRRTIQEGHDVVAKQGVFSYRFQKPMQELGELMALNRHLMEEHNAFTSMIIRETEANPEFNLDKARSDFQEVQVRSSPSFDLEEEDDFAEEFFYPEDTYEAACAEAMGGLDTDREAQIPPSREVTNL